MVLLEPCDLVANCGAAGLDAPVIAVNLLTGLQFVGLGGVVQKQRNILIQAVLIGLERQHIVPAPAGDGLSLARWACIASAVTMRPSSASISSSLGMAAISFDLLSTFT